MATPIGARVGAILKADAEQVHFLGWGVYDGDHEPPFGPFGMPKEEYQTMVAEMVESGRLPLDYVWTNPRITLDDGRVVWGCQCWWGPEDRVRVKIAGRRLVPARIDADV